MRIKSPPIDRRLLRRGNLFRNLSDETIEYVLKDVAPCRLKRNEYLFIQGDKATNIYVVLQGWIKVFSLNHDGYETVLATFTKGESFAEAASFLDGNYPASAAAVTEAIVLPVPAARMISKIKEDADVALSLLAATSWQLHELVRQVEQLKSQSGPQRLADFLVGLCPVSIGSCEVELPYDKSLIAGRLGMKPESLSRAFARLRDVGLSIDHNIAHINDIEILRTFASAE